MVCFTLDNRYRMCQWGVVQLNLVFIIFIFLCNIIRMSLFHSFGCPKRLTRKRIVVSISLQNLCFIKTSGRTDFSRMATVKSMQDLHH